ncbi:MAG TPA: 2-oxoacid:acceptor oxidoreductase family protein [Bacillota bacterium]|nr:2-oxoacid:acceptor oxidoreductase family protein [Bacillota bacterium]HOK68399.1 2-oxoacid:acceptor oxidoreductase family protein [Bacillota bacterium]HPP85162.1 2-oxoacid:acceptor oxidoreductase family protein [Bacillota bacterium]
MSAILIAGFGGQGVLFAGKQLALAGMKMDKQVSFIPSYGPEMRGGTSNCSVNIDDEPIGSPVVTRPEILLVLNLPSFEKFESKVVPGGTMIVNSSLVHVKSQRADIHAYYIPATELADQNGLSGLANVIMLGKMLKATGIFEFDYFRACLLASAPKSRPQLGEMNAKALEIGYNYEG